MAKYTYLDMFKKHPSWYRDFNRIVNHVENFSAELNHRGFFSNVGTLLSIGAGEGELEIREAKRHGFTIGYLDPTHRHVETFKHRLVEEGLQSRCLEISEVVFQQYLVHRTYDLVVAIHSWYEIGFDRASLEKAIACVAPGGRLFITLVSQTNPNWKVSHRFGEFPVPPPYAEGLSEWAKDIGFPHEFFINHRLVDSSLLLAGQKLSELGEAYASFLTRTPWKELGAEEQKPILELIRGEVKHDKFDLTSGCLVFQK